MTRKQIFSSKWMRIVAFAWLILFPLVFIAIPIAEVFTAEREITFETMKAPFYAFAVWILGPWTGSILLKYATANTTQEGSTKHE